jgi:hypothetical protein
MLGGQALFVLLTCTFFLLGSGGYNHNALKVPGSIPSMVWTHDGCGSLCHPILGKKKRRFHRGSCCCCMAFPVTTSDMKMWKV